jgi:para-aminobenzoate N-oxygenase AurF
LSNTIEAPQSSTLHRLADAPVRPRENDIDWQTPIDRSRWFLCETATPLYYAPIYNHLGLEHRRRYNQLTAMMTNEIIAFMESEFLVAILTAVSASRNHQPAGLRAAVVRFAEDERRHANIWWNLNRLSEPMWYRTGKSRLINIPPGVRSAARFVARHPLAFPVVFWLQLVQEERSLDISRRCMRVPVESIEPRYLAAYAAHLPDEARHVQIDRHLIEWYYRRRGAMVRRTSAHLFDMIVRALLVAPVHSTGRVVRVLADEYPELKPLVRQMLSQLDALQRSTEYHEMMYSRRATPVTFGLFDECPEFHAMCKVLLAYTPNPGRREP